jgi:hypothetical protein
MVKPHRRLIAALAVLAVAIVVGIAYGYLAGIALALGAITILLFVVGIPMGSDPDYASPGSMRRRMGLENDDPRRDR